MDKGQNEPGEAVRMVRALIDQGLLDKAAGLAGEVIAGLDSSKAPDLEKARLLNEAGYLYIVMSRWDDSWECYDRAMELARSNTPSKDPAWEAVINKIHLGMGKVTYRMGDYQTALDMLDRCLEGRGLDPDTEGNALIEMGNLYAERGDMQKAITSYLKAIEVLDETDNSSELGRACNNIADAYNKVEMSEDALEYAQRCIDIGREHGQWRNLVFGGMNAATASLRLGDIEGARGFHDLSKDNLSDANDPYSQGALFNLLGMIEREAGNYPESRNAFERARDLMEESQIRYYLARTLHEYGQLLERMGEPAKAREFYKSALEYLSADGSRIEAEKVKDRLAALEGSLERWE